MSFLYLIGWAEQDYGVGGGGAQREQEAEVGAGPLSPYFSNFLHVGITIASCHPYLYNVEDLF